MTARAAASGAGPAAIARLAPAAAPLLVGIVAFVLARTVLLPGQGFWDTGEFQSVPPVLGTAHPTGYPSYVILGWLATLVLAPAGEPALRMNLLSAVFLAAASGLTVVLVRGLTGRTAVAVAAGLLLALTPIAWRMGAFADPHPFHLALAAGLLVLLAGWEQRRRANAPGADRWLVAAAVVYGIMLGNHTLTTLLAPGIALYVLAVEPRIVRRPRFIATCALALLGTIVLLYLQLPIRAAMGAPIVYGHPDTWEGFWYVVGAEQFRGDLVDPFGDLAGKAAELVDLATKQLGVLVAAIPAAFLAVAIRRPRFALLTGAWLLVTCWFAAAYTNAAIDRYYLVPLLIVVTWLAAGAGFLVDALVGAPADDALERLDDAGRRPDDAGAAGTADEADGAADDAPAPDVAFGPPQRVVPAALAAVVSVGLAVALVGPAVLAAPATRTAVDQARDTRAADWSRWALETVEDHAAIVSWWSFSTPLWYRTVVLGERPDVWVVDDRDRLDENLGSVDDVIRATIDERPVYLVRFGSEIDALRAAWEIEVVPDPNGIQPLYRVVGPRSPAPGAAVPAPGAASPPGPGQPAPTAATRPCDAGAAVLATMRA